MIWTDALISEVERYLGLKRSAREIAVLLGKEHGIEVSRNAVIGICHRKGIALAHMPGKVAPKHRKHFRFGKPRVVKAPKKMSLVPPIDPKTGLRGVNVEPLPSKEPQEPIGCRYITGDPSTEDWRYCQHKQVEGRSYCAAHMLCVIDMNAVTRSHHKQRQERLAA